MTRTTARGAGALALALAAVVLVATPAHAAAYRYWTYWQAEPGAAEWGFSTQGPGTAIPADGAVEGWAFGVTTQSGSLDDAPATAADFAAICGGTSAEPDRKRVALVIDPGAAGIAPEGQVPPDGVATCVVVEPDATGYDVLRSVAEVRTEDGLICGIAGYPTGECAPVLDDAEATALAASAAAATAPAEAPASASAMASGSDDGAEAGNGSPLATIVVGVALIAAAALMARRMRRVR